VRRNGFTIGQALVVVSGSDGTPLNFGSVLRFNDLRFGVTNFKVDFDAENPIVFDGSIVIASGGAAFFPGSAFNALISDRTTADDRNPDGTQNTEAIRAELDFEAGKVKGLVLDIDTLKVTLGSVLTLTARDFQLNTAAVDTDDELVHFGAVGATVGIGSLVIGGEARNFGFTGTGAFVTGSNFAVILSVEGTSGSSLGWPGWLPIKIKTLGVEWPDIQNHPEDFTLLLSASVDGCPRSRGSSSPARSRACASGLAARRGQVPDRRHHRLRRVGARQPVAARSTRRSSAASSISRRPRPARRSSCGADGTPFDEIDDRVLFVGIRAASLAGIGFTCASGSAARAARRDGERRRPSDRAADRPHDRRLRRRGGVLQDAARDRRSAASARSGLPAAGSGREPATWLDSLQNQVVGQQRAAAEPGPQRLRGGFHLADADQGSARIWSAFTSQAVFNGQVNIFFSTDGKI
jgi:hypothetical protein